MANLTEIAISNDHTFRNASAHLWNNLHPSLISYYSCNSSSLMLFPFHNLRSLIVSYYPVSRLVLSLCSTPLASKHTT